MEYVPELAAVWREIEIPTDPIELERELSKAGIALALRSTERKRTALPPKVLTCTTSRRPLNGTHSVFGPIYAAPERHKACRACRASCKSESVTSASIQAAARMEPWTHVAATWLRSPVMRGQEPGCVS